MHLIIQVKDIPEMILWGLIILVIITILLGLPIITSNKYRNKIIKMRCHRNLKKFFKEFYGKKLKLKIESVKKDAEYGELVIKFNNDYIFRIPLNLDADKWTHSQHLLKGVSFNQLTNYLLNTYGE